MIYLNRGIAFFHKGLYFNALRDFIFATNDNQYDSFFCCWRGFIYSLLGNLSSAMTNLDRAIEIFADNECAYIKKGWVFFIDGKYNSAIENIDKALSMKEKSDFFGLGYRLKIFIYKERKDKENLKKTFKEAEKYFKKQIEEFPKDARNYAELAEIYCDAEENLSEAVELAKKALELKPDYISYYVLGRAYLANNKPKEALELFLKSLTLNSENIFCLYWVGKLYKYYLNDQQKAKEYFLMVMRTNPRVKFIIDELKTLP